MDSSSRGGGVAKIRVDGVLSRVAVEGSVSAVCWDSQGHYLGSSAMKIPGVNDPATLETLACREAMALALDLGLTHVIIACDNKGVVRDINQKNRRKLCCGGKGDKRHLESVPSVYLYFQR